MGQPDYLSYPTRYTAAEYFALEKQSAVRHEFFEGEIFAMAGESMAHNTIAGTLYSALRASLRGRSCWVFIEGVQVAIRENQHYAYPDVMVTCDPADAQATRRATAPVLLAEVLSESTEDYDRGVKFRHYQQLPSVRHYVLISQKQWLVEWFQRTPENTWQYQSFTEPAEELIIVELGLRLSVADLYGDSGVVPLRIVPSTALRPAK